MPHFPVVEIIHLLMKFRHNRPFMRISRVLLLSLIAVSAISYAGEWVKPIDPGSPACHIGKYACYFGPALPFPEVAYQLGASEMMFVLPVITLAAALLLFFKPPRTYLIILFLSLISIFLHGAAQPNPYLYSLSGAGDWLHLFCNFFIFLLSFPLALDEQLVLYPDLDYRKILPWFMLD